MKTDNSGSMAQAQASGDSYVAPKVTAVTPVGDVLIGTSGGWGSGTSYNLSR